MPSLQEHWSVCVAHFAHWHRHAHVGHRRLGWQALTRPQPPFSDHRSAQAATHTWAGEARWTFPCSPLPRVLEVSLYCHVWPVWSAPCACMKISHSDIL